MDFLQAAKERYTAKQFDPAHKIPSADMAKLEEILRLSPSSTNSQPWHFIVAETEEGKARLAKACSGVYAFNADKVLQASHTLLLCARTAIDEDYLLSLLRQEESDGRFPSAQNKEAQHQGRSYFVNRHRYELRDAQHWMEKQLYIALGFLLAGAAQMGIDSCTIEGFDQVAMDKELDLHTQGLNSVVMVALGTRAQDDYNAALPKSRLPLNEVVTRI